MSTTQIDLSWTSGGGSTVDYRISYQSGASAPANCATGTTISESSITGTTYSVTGLSAGTQYSFRICAINGNGTPDVSSGVTASATTSAGGGGGGGGPSAGDINLAYFVTGSDTVGYIYGPPGGTMTDNASYASASSSAYQIKGASLTLDYNDTPWISLTASDGSQYLEVGPSGTAFSNSSISSTYGDTGIVSIKGNVSGNDKILAVSGWTAGNITDFKEYHVFSTKTGSGSFSLPANIDNPTIGFGDPAPRGYGVASHSSGQVHFVAAETNQGGGGTPLLTYFTYSSGTWTASTAGTLLNKASDATTTCEYASHPAIAFDRTMSAHGLHIVYYCYRSITGGELIHLWHDGTMWKLEQISAVTMDVPSSTPDNTRIGFAVDNGRAIVAYWGSDGTLKGRVGTFSAGSYSWGSAVAFTAIASGITYHAPQVALDSGGLGRVAFMQYDVNPATPESNIILKYETAVNSWTSSTLKTLSHATNFLWIGSGLGITGMAGNSAR